MLNTGTPGDYEFGEDCDGSVSFTDGPTPIMTFGPACDPPRAAGARGRRDSAHVGIARPGNLSDPDLQYWVKDPHNPIQFGAAVPTSITPSPPFLLRLHSFSLLFLPPTPTHHPSDPIEYLRFGF